MSDNINYKFWNLVVVVQNDHILLIERNKQDFKGLTPPGGKVEFPETFMQSALRELKEETGLVALNLQQRGVSGFINSQKREQFIFIDYVCTSFEGELITNGPEGMCDWYHIHAIENLNIKADIKTRILELLKNNIYEYQMFWDESIQAVYEDKLDSDSFIELDHGNKKS